MDPERARIRGGPAGAGNRIILVHLHGPVALEPSEQALVWVSLAVGLVGTAGTLWQVYRFYRGRKESRTQRLRENVLHPWSKAELIWKDTPSETPLVKVFQVPSAALPEKVAAMVNFPYPGAGQWLELDKLPGLSRGKAFLRENHSAVWEEWRRTEGLFREYSALRASIVGTAHTLVREGMQTLHPGLAPAPKGTYEPTPGTYVVAHIVSSVATDSYHIALFQDESRARRLSLGSTQSGDVVTWDIRGEKTFLKVSGESEADLERMQALYDSWLQDTALRSMAGDFVEREAALEKALEGFGKMLQEVTLQIEYSEGRRRQPAR